MRTESRPALSLNQLLIAKSSHTPFVNPHASTAETTVLAWARQSGIYIPGIKLVLGTASYLYPKTSLERLVVMGKMLTLLFYIDDVYGDLTSSQGLEATANEVFTEIEGCCSAFSVKSVPEGAEGDAAIGAFLHIRQEMDGLAPVGWLNRFSESLSEHLYSSVLPNMYGWNAQAQSVPGYIHVRERTSGMYPTVDFIEFANNAYLPQRVINLPVIGQLRLDVARIGSLSNDLFSYHKEVTEQGLLMNLVQVIQTTEHLSVAQSLQKAVDLINDATRDFQKSVAQARGTDWRSARLDAQTVEAIERYITGLEYEISATWYWQLSTNRYRSAASPFVELSTPLQ
ncbi:MAG TPA: terpene synthase family protein [Aggregatilineales bacterium]|nr:terpene synthase family protein [Aggregatilineales bacterium]